MHTTVAREQFSKYVSTETNTCNNRRAVFSVKLVLMGYKNDKEDHLSQLSFETPASQNMSLGLQELKFGIEASELLSAVQLRDKSPAVKRRIYVCCSILIIVECDSVRL
jgi:hypothetical protein